VFLFILVHDKIVDDNADAESEYVINAVKEDKSNESRAKINKNEFN
jgi:hypothetical protein